MSGAGFDLLETTLAEAISEWETTEGGPSNGGPTLAHYLATTLRQGSVEQRMEAMGMERMVLHDDHSPFDTCHCDDIVWREADA